MAIKNNKQSGLSLMPAYAKQAGVTLIELIVVVAIVAVVSSVLIFNYSDFSTNVSIQNLSQEVALSVRKAQTYATSVEGISGIGGARTYPAYGISFDLDPTSSQFLPNKKQFILFVDMPDPITHLPNKKYDSNGSCGNPIPGDECLESFTIDTADTISEICTDVTGCVSSGAVDITFLRPAPDAIICFKTAGNGGDCQTTSLSNVNIVLQSAKGLNKTVSIWNTGQISVK